MYFLQFLLQTNGFILKLSILIVAHNEESNLHDCINTCLSADEIIIVLDKTTDNSKKVIERFDVKLYEGEWLMEGKRRNFGLSKCKGDWVLEVDADERLSPKLLKEIREKIIDAEPGYFLVPFQNYIGKRLIKYGWGASWGVSMAPRLSYKGKKIWNEKQRIHPSIVLKGKKHILQNYIVHYVDKDLNDMVLRLIRYSNSKAEDIVANNLKIPSFWITVRRALSRFFKCYVSRKGYKEGKWGFIIALMAFMYIILSYSKADLERKKYK